MPLTRLLYFSENTMDGTGAVLPGLRDIMRSSQRNNAAANVTGALVFDDQWFLQALEGERADVWQTLRRIEVDERHCDVVIVDARQIEGRLFCNWWMGLATRSEKTAAAFAPHMKNGLLRPQDMNADDVLHMMVALSQIGLARKVERLPDDPLP